MVKVIYKTPSQAAQIGTTLTDECILSSSDAKKLRDEYKLYELGQAWSFGAVATVLGVAMKPFLSIAFGLSSGAVLTLASDYIETLDNNFDALIAGDEFKKVKAVYKYRRKGSNDGAYWLTSVTVA